MKTKDGKCLYLIIADRDITYKILLSKEQIKVFDFLANQGWDFKYEKLSEEDIIEL